MSETNHPCDLWKHTIVKIFKHDPKSELGLMLNQWVIFNKENFNSILNYTIADFTPSGNLCYFNEHGEVLHQTLLHELFNLRWYIQHLMDKSADESGNPLSHTNWMKQTNWKFIKYLIHHKHSMTPQQLKQKPLKEIFKNGHEKLDIQEVESNQDEEETTTSSEMSERVPESDTTGDDTDDSETTQTLQIHNVSNTTMHDEDNSSEPEDHSSEENSVNQIQPCTEDGEQNITKDNELVITPTNFEVKVENQNFEGLITYSTDQQIFKLKVNSGSNQELWGVYIDFQSIHSKWTIDAILQHMGIHATTENPNVMMREITIHNLLNI